MGEVEVRFFAAAIDAAGTAKTVVDLGEDPTIGDLKVALTERYGERMGHIVRVAAYLIGDELVRDPSHPLAARVDVLPPFAGG